MDRSARDPCVWLCAVLGRSLGLFLALSLAGAVAAQADVLTITPVAAATGRDDAPRDDVYDGWSEGDFVVVLSLVSPSGFYERRGVYEFDLDELTTAGATSIESATLRLPQSSAYKLGAYYYAMQVYGYPGDGAIQLVDFEIETGQLGAITVDLDADEYPLDVTAFVQERFAAGEIAGFNLVSNQTDMQVILHDDAVLQAELEIVFAPPAQVPALGPPALLASSVLLGGLGLAWLRSRRARLAAG